MIEIRLFGAQGDVVFRRVDAVPAGAVAENPCEGLVVAHPETGHHHVIEGRVTRHKTRDPLVSYIESGSDVLDVKHHRPWDTHETLRLLGGVGAIWEVRRQREWVPEGWRQVED